jgi:anti-sigma factor ChrR (cupin superfamily)
MEHRELISELIDEELLETQSTLALLAYTAPSVSPPAHLKARLFERVQASSAVVAEPARARLMMDFSLLDWQPLEDPGVSVHWLRRDEATGTFTALVKIQPGCPATAHLHPGGEDCLVLHGGFRDRRGEYRAGDFVYYEPGSAHHDFKALEGDECILLVVAHGGLEPLPAEV